MISSKYSIREQNEALILKAIIDHTTISRSEASLLTGLNKASVSAITKKLIDDDLVLETGIGDASLIGGRKPILLSFNPQSALAISFDIGYNYIEGLLSYLDGKEMMALSKRNTFPTSATIVDLLREMITELEKKAPETTHGIVGMTLAIHGVVAENMTRFTPYYDLDKIDLVAALAAFYTYPITIENEANLAALAEYTFSSQFDSLISLSVHSGIGAGIVADGKLLVGKHGMAGEIGHSIIYPEGLPCPCGNQGCLEQYASNKVFYDRVAQLKKLTVVNSAVVRDLFDQNDQDVLALVQQNCLLLAAGINNLITLYDPEIVIINSSLYREIPEMIALVKKEMTSHFTRQVVIQNSTLNNRATLLGALAITSQNFLNVQKLKLTPPKQA